MGRRVTAWYNCARCDAGYPDQGCTCGPDLTPPERPSSIAAAAMRKAEAIHHMSQAFAACLYDALAHLDLMEEEGFGAEGIRNNLSAAILAARHWSEP